MSRLETARSPHVGRWPDASGHFGLYGGRYVPEVLMEPLRELEKAYAEARLDPAFALELELLLRDFVGRPTPLTLARTPGRGVLRHTPPRARAEAP